MLSLHYGIPESLSTAFYQQDGVMGQTSVPCCSSHSTAESSRLDTRLAVSCRSSAGWTDCLALKFIRWRRSGKKKGKGSRMEEKSTIRDRLCRTNADTADLDLALGVSFLPIERRQHQSGLPEQVTCSPVKGRGLRQHPATGD